ALLNDRNSQNDSGLEDRLDRHPGVRHDNDSVVGRVAVVLPREQVPAFARIRGMTDELRRAHCGALTIAPAGTSANERFLPAAPVGSGLSTSGDTPGWLRVGAPGRPPRPLHRPRSARCTRPLPERDRAERTWVSAARPGPTPRPPPIREARCAPGLRSA